MAPADPASDYADIRLTHKEGAARIVLDRPDSLNAWTPELGSDLLDAVQRTAGDPTVRAIAISGAGRGFSSGADLRSKRETTTEGDPDLSTRLREIYNPVIAAIAEAPKPYIASVHGAAAGLGCSLALACDLIVAAESAFFLLPFARIGLAPDAGAVFHTAARVGLTRATEMAIRAERISAPRALEWGMINEVVADERHEERTEGLLAELATGPTVAYGSIKRLLRAGAGAGLAEQMEREAAVQQFHATTHDYTEGVTAFKEKRPPRFRGS